MEKKYRLTEEKKKAFGKTLYRIQALKSFGEVNEGDLGGFIEAEKNLAQEGDAWVFGDARVYGDAEVYGDAWVCGTAEVCGNAWVYGDARVCGNAWVSGDARVCGNAWVSGDAEVYGTARVYGDAWVCGTAEVFGNNDILWVSSLGSRSGTTTFFRTQEGGIGVRCGCFEGTLEQFEEKVRETHGDNLHGRCYALAIALCRAKLLGE